MEEIGPQRRVATDGRLLHCCCMCGKLDTWGETWCHYSSIKQVDDGEPIPKFCSDKCKQRGGTNAGRVSAAMRQAARDKEFRPPLSDPRASRSGRFRNY